MVVDYNEYLEHNHPWLDKVSVKPEVGMGATCITTVDLFPYTVRRIISDTEIVVLMDKPHEDGTFTPNDNAQFEHVATLQDDGRWIDEEGYVYYIGERFYYIEKNLEF